MNIHVSTDNSLLDLDFCFDEISNSYWAKGIPRDVFERSVEGALCFGVYLENKQIGFARVVSDFATFAYLGDVVIAKDFRGKGYSKTLMDFIMNQPELQGLRRFCLMTGDAHDLYRKYGFEESTMIDRYMEIRQPYNS